MEIADNLTLISILLIVLVFGCLLLRHRQQRKSIAKETKSVGNSYYAVTVDYGEGACEAVIKLENQRFIVHEAPLLPMPGCDPKHCKCRYTHYSDRRDEDRRSPFASIGGQQGHERRSKKDRRQNDEQNPNYFK